MPLYEYQCASCGVRFERIQQYSDAPVETCPSCGGVVEKLVSSPAIQFRGSGFYITDYARRTAGSDAADSSSSDSTGAAAKDGAGNEPSTKESTAAKDTPAKDAGSKDSGSKESTASPASTPAPQTKTAPREPKQTKSAKKNETKE